MDLRFKKASMQLSDTTQIKRIKKDIARLETRLTELRFLKGENNDAG
jgi:ribosomal protein L29